MLGNDRIHRQRTAGRLPSLLIAMLVAFGLCKPLVADQYQEPVAAVGSTGVAVPERIFTGYARIDESELAEMRGGLSVAGMKLNFGATLRTLIDSIELTTSYRISEAGVQLLSQMFGPVMTKELGRQGNPVVNVHALNGQSVVQLPVSIRSTVPPNGVPAVTPGGVATSGGQVNSPPPVSGAANLAGGTAGPAGGSATLVGPGTGKSVVDLAPPNVVLPGVENFRGIVLNDIKGFTAALHDISRRAIVSSLISTASDRKIRQRLDLDIRLQNAKQVRAATLRSKLSRINRPR